MASKEWIEKQRQKQLQRMELSRRGMVIDSQALPPPPEYLNQNSRCMTIRNKKIKVTLPTVGKR